MKTVIAILLLLLTFTFTFAADGPSSPSSTNTAVMLNDMLSHYWKNAYVKPIGACLWWRLTLTGIKIYPTMEWDEYEPDLVVTVYNGDGTNPWTLEKDTLDKLSFPIARKIAASTFHFSLGNGRGNTQVGALNRYTKSVDIVGNPFMLLHSPWLLRSDTQVYHPYYQSSLDAVPSRSGIAEAFRPEDKLLLHPIGSNVFDHWGYEFPRTMTVLATSDYKASLMIALHAADIVTNRNALHVVDSTADSCGKNCAVSNVIEEHDHQHAIWQEVYPKDREVHIGQSNFEPTSLGAADDNAGNGNYVFVIWRHYRGCIQGKHFMFATTSISATQKR